MNEWKEGRNVSKFNRVFFFFYDVYCNVFKIFYFFLGIVCNVFGGLFFKEVFILFIGKFGIRCEIAVGKKFFFLEIIFIRYYVF